MIKRNLIALPLLLSSSLCYAMTINNNTNWVAHVQILEGDAISHDLDEVGPNSLNNSVSLLPILSDLYHEITPDNTSETIQIAAMFRSPLGTKIIDCSPSITITKDTKIKNLDKKLTVTFQTQTWKDLKDSSCKLSYIK